MLFVVFLFFLAYAVKPEASYRVRQSDGKRAYAELWMRPIGECSPRAYSIGEGFPGFGLTSQDMTQWWLFIDFIF